MATGEHGRGGAGGERRLHGLLAEFDDVDDLLDACEKVRDSGYTRWDSHTPFPVHGIEGAMGIRMTILPWIVLAAGLAGLGIALWMQWWMNAVDYPYVISGKPFFSVPANIPVCFELTVLLSAFGAFFSVLGLNMLPQLHHPLFASARFKRATDDRFFITIDAADPLFERGRTSALLGSCAVAGPLEEIMDAAHHPSMPKGILAAAVVLVCLSLVPLAFILRARYATTTEPAIHLVWDMDWQKKYKSQAASPLFADGRADRPQVQFTVARGDLIEERDLPLRTGRDGQGAYLTDFPVAVNEALMRRGRERYGIHCAPCHGLDGGGRGIVVERAARTRDSTLVTPTDYHTDAVRQQPVGQLFETITNGIRTMPAYGGQVQVEDRWAIVLYIRALQKSRNGALSDVPAEKRAALAGN